MKIYPATDIQNGRCVRLVRGEANSETVYFDNPVDAAKSLIDSGARRLHVVDLDGAFGGTLKNIAIIEKICSLGIFVELGGGLRSEELVNDAFNAGVSRAIIGTRACSEPEFAELLAEKYGGKIAVGIDAKDGFVATKGWVEVSKISALSLAKRLALGGVGTFIYTDIGTDGTLGGPNLVTQEEMLKLLAPIGANLIASGGVSNSRDILNLKALSLKYPNLDGAIVGKALYEGKVNLAEINGIAEG